MTPLVCNNLGGANFAHKENRAIRHDILDFCERELVTLSGGGVEMKMAIIVLVEPRWNYQ